MITKLFSDLIRRPSAVMLARQELEEAQRSLLTAHSATEYARKMAEYHMSRVHRLSDFLRNAHENEKK